MQLARRLRVIEFERASMRHRESTMDAPAKGLAQSPLPPLLTRRGEVCGDLDQKPSVSS